MPSPFLTKTGEAGIPRAKPAVTRRTLALKRARVLGAEMWEGDDR